MSKFQPWEYTSPQTVCAAPPAKSFKKMTGTRLGKVLGLDSWGSPFQAWCEITRVAEEPFTGNKYTDAGNALEPKIIEWCKDSVSPYVYTPEEFYGVADAKQSNRYDFFPDNPVLGGMWDAIILDSPLSVFKAGNGKALGYVEAKTSSRPQDWTDGPPLKYAIQGLLYGHLDNLPRVFIPVRFMEEHEYANPEACECNDGNTLLYEMDTRDTLINDKLIAEHVEDALVWYGKHVVANASPEFDEKRDAKFLDIMRKSEVKHDGLELLAKEAAILEAKIAVMLANPEIKDAEKRLKTIKAEMKPQFVEMFTLPEHKNDEIVCAYGWKVKKSAKETIDKEQMAADNVLEKYTIVEDTFTMSKDTTKKEH